MHTLDYILKYVPRCGVTRWALGGEHMWHIQGAACVQPTRSMPLASGMVWPGKHCKVLFIEVGGICATE